MRKYFKKYKSTSTKIQKKPKYAKNENLQKKFKMYKRKKHKKYKSTKLCDFKVCIVT